MKIIVVDDELASLNTFLPSVLDDLNIECKMFMSRPRSALEYVRQNNVDMAFVDIVMPEINGVDLAERLVEVRPSIRIVLISAYPQDRERIKLRLGDALVGFCEKPYQPQQVISLLTSSVRKTEHKVFLRTFDAFDLFVDGVAINFSSSKAKELLALLTDANGSYVTMDTTIGNLWSDKSSDLAKRLYRDAVCRLRLTLREAGIDGLVSFERARAVMNTQMATCDLWDYLKHGGVFSGRYMPQYDWSIVTESMLEQRH